MKTSIRFPMTFAVLGALGCAAPTLATPTSGAAATELEATQTATPGTSQGFLYGKIVTESDTTYEGRLRWDDEEAFWGDFFNSSKERPDFLDDVPDRDRRRRRPIKVFGITIGISWDDGWDHQFVARFGDVDRIEVGRGEDATVVMKSGTRIDVDGGSNDLGGTLFVWDKSLGEVELEWDNVRTIQFSPAPATLQVPVRRLHGTVKTLAGELRGYVQWDQEECLSTDKLDGETRDGKLSIEMGRIKTIERRSRSSSRVVLVDGREHVLDGTNDVDDDNRGIYVEDPRYGRVLVPWSAFERVDFNDAGSGPSYASFAPGRPLAGTVKTTGGQTLSGRIIYDLDEAETWELLNGTDRNELQYSIPFALVRSITPQRGNASEVVLRSGEKLILEDSADVGDDNGGVLVYEQGKARPTYLEWSEVARVDFDG